MEFFLSLRFSLAKRVLTSVSSVHVSVALLFVCLTILWILGITGLRLSPTSFYQLLRQINVKIFLS